tara:strand:+ start:49135 stop:49881 length:747 start_codon:yes stop_codon:yes gene_type:complete
MVLDHQRGAIYSEWSQKSWPERSPELVLVVSAHWETPDLALGTDETRDLIYDFYGFPEELYRISYPAPGSPHGRKSLKEFLESEGLKPELSDRGWDHGVWTPLYWLFPGRNVPVLQVSLPRWPAERLFELGRSLSRWMKSQQSVWLIGSGGLTHNLGAIDFSGRMPVPEPMHQFQNFVKERLENGQLEELIEFKEKAPHASLNHPSPEHFLPLIVVAGAAHETGGLKPEYPLDGFELGSLSKTSIDFV